MLYNFIGMGVVLSICCILSEHLFLRTPLDGCFCIYIFMWKKKFPSLMFHTVLNSALFFYFQLWTVIITYRRVRFFLWKRFFMFNGSNLRTYLDYSKGTNYLEISLVGSILGKAAVTYMLYFLKPVSVNYLLMRFYFQNCRTAFLWRELQL